MTATIEITMDAPDAEPDAEVARPRDLGASVETSVDETNEGFIRWTTLSDPWGTLFCVCPARTEEPTTATREIGDA